jgi:hypothetical protein
MTAADAPARWPLGVRILSVVAGLAGAVAVLVFGGIYALLTGCVDDATPHGFCPRYEDLATVLELIALTIGVVAPAAGGMIAASRSRGVALATGLGLGALMFLAILVLTTGQDGLLS